MIKKKQDYKITKVLFESDKKTTMVSLYCKVTKETEKAIEFQVQKTPYLKFFLPKSALTEFRNVTEHVDEAFLKSWYSNDYVKRIYSNYGDLETKKYGSN